MRGMQTAVDFLVVMAILQQAIHVSDPDDLPTTKDGTYYHGVYRNVEEDSVELWQLDKLLGSFSVDVYRSCCRKGGG